MNAHDVFVVDSAGGTTIERSNQSPSVCLGDEDWNLVRVVRVAGGVGERVRTVSASWRREVVGGSMRY